MGRARQQVADSGGDAKGLDAQTASDAEGGAQAGGDAGNDQDGGNQGGGDQGGGDAGDQDRAGGSDQDGGDEGVGDEGELLFIKSTARNGHRRAGFTFPRTGVRVRKDWLSEDELAAIEADPRLVIVPAE